MLVERVGACWKAMAYTVGLRWMDGEDSVQCTVRWMHEVDGKRRYVVWERMVQLKTVERVFLQRQVGVAAVVQLADGGVKRGRNDMLRHWWRC